MADYSIKLGVTVDTSDIVSQINEAEKKVDPIKIKIDAETKELTNTIREALNSLSKGTKNALTLDTTKIEGSLTDIKNAVVDLKKTFNSIDSGANFKPLVSSVNQVSNALNKAENESDNLVKSLNALGKKDVKINVGLDLDKKNEKIIQDYNKSLAKKVSTNSDIDGFLRDFNLTSKNAKIVRDDFLSLTKAMSHGVDSDAYEKSLTNLLNSVKKLGTVSKEIDSQASDIIKALNSYNLDVSGDYYKQEFGDDWKSVRGKHQSMLADKNSLTKTSVDVAYEELSERFPEYFSKEIWNQADQLRKIFDVYDAAKLNSRARKVNVSEVYDDSYLRNYASDIVSDIQEQVRAEQQLVQSSNAATDTIVQNQQRQQEATKSSLEAKKAEIEQEKKRLTEINKSIDDYNNRFLEASTTGDPNAMEYYAKMQSLEADSESLKSHIDALDAAYNKEVQQAQETANAVSQAEERKQQAYQETVKTISSIQKGNFQKVFDPADDDLGGMKNTAKSVEQYFKNLQGVISDTVSVKEQFDSDGNLDGFVVSLKNASGEAEKLRYAFQAGTEDGRAFFKYTGGSIDDKAVGKQIEKSVKKANDLQIKLDKVQSGYLNSTKPIKDNDHVKSLGDQYDKVKAAIDAVRNADDATYQSMVSNVETEIATLESLVAKYRNIETVATSLRSKDFDTVKATYADKLDEKISKIQGAGVYKSDYGEVDGEIVTFEKRAEQLKAMLSSVAKYDRDGLVQFLNELDKLESGYKKTKAAKDEFNKSQNVGSSVSGLKSELEILQQASPSIKSFKTEISGAEVSIESLLKDLDQVGTKGDFKVVEGKVEAFGKAAEAAGIDLNEAKNEAKKANDAYKQMLDIQKQIRSLSIKEKNLTELGNTNELNEVSAKLKDLKADYESLKRTFGSKLTDAQFGTLQAEVDATESELKQLDAKWADTKVKLAKTIKADIELGNVENEMDSMRVKFNSLSDANDKLRNSFEATENAYKVMMSAAKANTGDEVADREQLIQAEKEYAAALEKTNNLIKQQARRDSIFEANEKLDNSHKSLKLDMVNWLKNNSRAAKEYEDKIYDLIGALNKLEQAGNLKQIDVNSTRSQFNLLTKDAERRGLTGLTVWDKLLNKAKEYASYLSAAELFMYAEQAFSSMFEQVKLIDSAMTELKKVTDETDASYNNFLSDASSRAKEIGTTIDGLVSSTADFARLGYSMSEATELAEVANIYSVVGDDIESVETATESLISTMTAFGVEASNSMSIVDKFNAVGNNFAISSGGIGEALERSASSMAAANNSLDETIALITAANTVVQDPASVGQAFKTISMRIRGAKTELEDAGLDAEGMADSTAKLRQEIMALSGVDIMLDSTTFKSTYKIMEELSSKWEDLTDIQQASITELIAGKRQGNIVSSLMTNFDIAQNALQTSLNSSGSALEEHSKAMDSIELKLNSLKAAWQSFAQSFMDSSLLKKGIDALRTIVEILEWLVDNFGLLGTIGLGTSITGFIKHLNGVKEAKKTLNDVVDAIYKIGDAALNATESASNMANAVTEAADATTNVASAATEASEATANLASTATETAESAANMASTVSESVEATTNLASASTEAAEAGANVASVVTEGAEAAANAASATTESAEAMANLTSVVTETSEALANMLSAITETTEAMANMASTASETVEAGANVVSTVTEVAEASANAASARTEVVEAGADVVSTVAAIGENAVKSSGGLNKFAGGLGKTVSSAAKWVGVAGLVVAGLALIYNQYKKNKEAAAEARQEIIENSNTYLDAASNFEQAYIKYSGRTDLTVSEEAELEEAIKGTTNALKDKSSALHGVVNSSNDYIASLERIADAELNAAAEAAEAKKKEAGASLIESAIGWERFDGSEVNIEVGRSMTSDLSLTDKEVKIAKEIGEEYYKLDSYGKDLQGTIYSLTLDSNAGVNEIIDYYYTLLDYQSKLKDGLTEEELANSSVYEDVSSVIGKLSESIEVYTSGAYEAAKAQYQLANGIPKTTEAYLAMREAILGSEDIKGLSLDTKMSILNSLDSDYSKIFDLSSVEAQARKFVGIIEGFDDGVSGANEIGAVETFLNMRTAVNNNECTVGEYLSEFDNITSIAKKFSDEEREQFNLAFGLDTDSIKEQYEHVYNYISRQDIDWFDGYEFTPEFRLEKDNIKEQEIRKFLDDLSASELSALVGIKAEIDWENTSIEDIRKQIETEAKIIDALNFKPNIEIDTTALEMLNTALEESASAMGLTTESIDSLKSKYSDLESYDPDTLFEKTANGVKVNREEVEKLEKEYNDLNKSKVKEHIDNLTQAYNENAKKIDECTNASERAQLISENETYRNQIEELAQYQAQLEGVTGAYQDWIDAQSGPEDYEGYESVATSREDIEDEISRGFIGNKARAYIDLLSGKDLDGKSIDDYADAWEKLDDKVTSTGYSVMDFFTINDDGDITATGIDRFMKSVKKDIEGLYDSDTGAYKFTKENIEAIQKEYEIGAEAIELLLEAAAAAGYEIDWGGILDDIDLDTSSFESLVSAAEAAQTAYNKIDGLEDVHFNFTATGVEEAESEIERARQAFSKFINEDGTVNLKADGAEEMQFILTTLIIQKQQLSTPAIMKVDTSQIDQAETDIIGAINAAQTLQSAYENYEIAISTGVDVEKAKSDLNTAIDGMKGTSVDVRADLKLPTDADLEAAKSSIGDIKVGATLDGTAVGNLATQIQTQCTPEIIAKVTGIDESAITNGEGGRQVKYTPEHSEVDAYINSLADISKKIIYTYTTEGSKPNPSNIERTITYKYTIEGTGPAAGTAHASGSTQSGRAFARGDWGIKGNGVALGGELGQELVVRDGKFFTIGDSGAEFFRYRKNDIIFNAAQTESLFKYGGIKGAKPRGTMLASGTAFADGNAFAWSATATESNFASNRNSSTGKSYGSKSSSSSSKSSSDSVKDDFEETFDLIEMAIDRVERAIDQLDTKANSVYRSWSERNSNLTSEISKVSSEIDLQQRAYQEYMNAAAGVGLSSSWQAKIKNGAIDITTVKDEALAEKIKDFQKYYEAALSCKDAILELKETESKLYAQRFENLQTQYDGILQGYEHTEAMLNEYISQAEEQGYIVSKKYYANLIANEKQNINALKQEQTDLIKSRDEAVSSGKIAKNSEEW